MAVITIGAAAINRNSYIYYDKTLPAKENPANDTGTLDTIEIWASVTMAGCKVGTFYGSGTSYTSRDVETIGGVTAGSKQTFTGLSIDVTTGDYIGTYYPSGKIEAAGSGGAGVYYKAGDQFGAGQQTYGLWAAYIISLCGTGATAGVGWTGKISGVTNPAEIMGVSVANIAEVKGVA